MASPDERPYPGDEMVTLDDGRTLPLKRTICLPKGNLLVPAGRRVKLTAKLREEAEGDEELLRSFCEKGAVENVKEFIEKGTDVNARCKANGATALMIAATQGSLECCKMLIDAGANVHYANVCYDTALTAAVLWGHREIVELLLEKGVDPRMWNDQARPRTVLDICDEYERSEIKELVSRYWAKLDERDQKREEKEERKRVRAIAQHRAQVSREAEERRQAAAAS